jgi:hypothetical protein
LRVKKIKNLFEKVRIYIGVDRDDRKELVLTFANKPHPFLDEFIWNVVDNCNLNCRSCSVFCPIAKEKSISVTDFERDILRIKELTKGGEGLKRINISGGEALLHPNLLDLITIARGVFPNTILRIGSNGILLSRQNDEFWDTLGKNRAVIIITRYPIKLDWKTINKKSDEFGVEIEYQGLEIGKKTTHYMPLDLEGKQDNKKNFKRCRSVCLAFKDGKFYVCGIAATVNIFNEYFGKNVGEGEQLGIDIHKAQSMEEIFDFLMHPTLCKYCDIDRYSYNHEWGVSKKEISEYI